VLESSCGSQVVLRDDELLDNRLKGAVIKKRFVSVLQLSFLCCSDSMS